MRSCQECKQTLPPVPGLTQEYKESEIRIIEIIRRAGTSGIMAIDMLPMIYEDGTPTLGTKNLTDRIYQLNKKLKLDGKRLKATRFGDRKYIFEDTSKPLPMLQTPDASTTARREKPVGYARGSSQVRSQRWSIWSQIN